MPDSCGQVKNRSSANKKAAGHNCGYRMTACCYSVAAARKSARCWSNSGGCRCRKALKTATERCCRAERRCRTRVDDRYEC